MCPMIFHMLIAAAIALFLSFFIVRWTAGKESSPAIRVLLVFIIWVLIFGQIISIPVYIKRYRSSHPIKSNSAPQNPR